MLIPYLLSSLIDNGVEKGDMGYILMVGGCMVVIAMVGLFAGIMGGVYGAKASTGFAKNLRRVCLTISRPTPFLTLTSSAQRDL